MSPTPAISCVSPLNATNTPVANLTEDSNFNKGSGWREGEGKGRGKGGEREREGRRRGSEYISLCCVEIEDCLPKRRLGSLFMSKDTKTLLTSQFNSGQRLGIPWEGNLWPLGKVPKQEVVGIGGSHWAEGVGAGCSTVCLCCEYCNLLFPLETHTLG